MKRLLLGTVLLFHLSCTATRAETDQIDQAGAGSRGQRAGTAAQKLLELRFFAEGRGMMMVPELIDVYTKLSKAPGGTKPINRILEERWGFVINNGWPSGLSSVEYEDFDVGVLGCAACHSSKAAGVFIPGLGNKNIDVLRVGKEVWLVQKMFKKLNIKPNQSEAYKNARKFALNFAHTLADEQIGNLTQGLVPVSLIKTWFYKQAGEPYPRTMNRGAVKVPALWGYGVKRHVGQFCDGFGRGNGWAVAVELTAGQEPETVRGYLDEVEDAEEILGDLLPPKYPFPNEIDAARAKTGKAIFDGHGRCWECHGTYELDQEGYSIYKEVRFVSIDLVKTDRDRTDVITPEFLELVRTSKLNDVIAYNERGRGYFAPRLEGIWARFPYLHNASVPSLRAMLTDPEERPVIFNLEEAGELKRFDRENVGLTVAVKGSPRYVIEEQKAKANARSIYDTRRTGQSNRGHPFGTDLQDEEKDALIQYLKTL